MVRDLVIESKETSNLTLLNTVLCLSKSALTILPVNAVATIERFKSLSYPVPDLDPGLLN